MIGSALVDHLRGRGDTVIRLVRKAAVQPDECGWDPAKEELHLAGCKDVDVIVNLSGATLGRRWGPRYKRLLLNSRVRATRTLARAAAALGQHVTLVSASAVGYYGDRGSEPLTETSGPGSDFLADLVQRWEAATKEASAAGNRVVLARTGLALSPAGGAMKPMMPLLKLGLGGPLGPGTQYWPWISLNDEVRALTWLIDKQISGPVNLTSPATSTHAEIVRAVARGLGRPAVLGVPTWALRLVLGEATDMVVASQNQRPEVLVDSGFVFEQPTLPELVEWFVSQRDGARPARIV